MVELKRSLQGQAPSSPPDRLTAENEQYGHDDNDGCKDGADPNDQLFIWLFFRFTLQIRSVFLFWHGHRPFRKYEFKHILTQRNRIGRGILWLILFIFVPQNDTLSKETE